MMNIPDPMPLQPACGGPLSSPDTFFDLRIVFLPVSGKSSSSPFRENHLPPCSREKYLFPYYGIIYSSWLEKDEAENALR